MGVAQKSAHIVAKESFTEEMKYELAHKEFYVSFMRNQLCDIIQDTMNQIRKKQTRTLLENEEEKNYDDIEEEDLSDSEEEEAPYNPKNLPLGWDGKPIPYWLYKLHGLNISYKCEICGNFTYKGPKAFQRHFAEWRHAHGMRCLGIPNTAHFANVTAIEDAMALWEKLKQQKHDQAWKPEQE